MKSLRTLRLSLLSSFIALVAMLVLAVGVSAHTAPAREAAVVPYAGAPITNIVRTSSGLAFSPNSMQIYLAHTTMIEVVNTTGAPQLVYDANNHLVVKLMPHTSNFFHYSYTGTIVYHLGSNPKATFTALVS